jgi:hypothetical protein
MEPKPIFESGVLPRNDIHLEWWLRLAWPLALLQWYWGSRLRPLVEEMGSLPWRIAASMSLRPGTVGLEIPGPEGVEGRDLLDRYLHTGIACIEGLARGNRWWGPRDTFVAFQAFRQGAKFGLSISGTCKRCICPQSAELTMNP